MQTHLQRLVAATAVALLVGLAVADVLLPGDIVVLVSLFGVAPLLAASVLSPRMTALLAAVTVALAGFSGAWDDDYGKPNFGVRVTLVGALAVVAVVNATVRSRREARLARVTSVADVVQRAVLPRLPPELGTLRFGTRYHSAHSDVVVGGDFFDLVGRPDGARLLIGDVRGKGLDAVEQSARTVRLFRQAAAVHDDLVEVALEVERQLGETLEPEDFVTALFVELSAAGDLLETVNCGHHPPMLLADGGWRLLDDLPARPPLGVSVDGTAPATVAGRCHWPASGRLLLYTDGLIEGRNRHGEFLPLARVAEVVAEGSPQAAVDRLVDVLLEHVGGTLPDDLALVAVDRVPLPRHPTGRLAAGGRPNETVPSA